MICRCLQPARSHYDLLRSHSARMLDPVLIIISYDEEPASKPTVPAPAPKAEPEPALAQPEPASAPPQIAAHNGEQQAAPSWQPQAAGGDDSHMDHSGFNAGGNQSYDNAPMEEDNYGPINVKEDG